MEEKKKTNKSLIREALYFLGELAICLIVVELFVNFVARPIRVVGSSMYPTYDDGSIGIMYKLNMDEEDLKRFDVLIINCEQKDELIIKRLIGFPGETVTMENDVLTIDGVVYDQYFLDEDYVNNYKTTYNNNFTNDFSITLGEGEYFVLGDNRPYSADSRYFGPFSYEDIEGRNGFIIYPFSDFGSFE